MRAFPLPFLLWLDAVACAAMAAPLLVASRQIAAATALPPGLLVGAGLALVFCAALMAWAAAAPAARRAWVRLIVLGNWAWVAASLLVLLPGVGGPNALGAGLVLAQAAAVAALALGEGAALKRVGAGRLAMAEAAR